MSLSARITAMENAALALGRADFYNDDQPRDENGRFAGEPGSVAGAADRMAMGKQRFAALKVGDTVKVERYGNTYQAKVVSRTDKTVKAAFKYGNGADRTVKVEWQDLVPPHGVKVPETEEHATAEALKKAVWPVNFSARVDALEEFVVATAALQFGGKGNPDALRHWYADDPEDRFKWGEDGDFMLCVEKASEYMTEDEAKGFCNLRHKEATGHYPGEKNAHG